MSQLGQLTTAVGDPTDPAGTLRPNLPPEPETGDNFDPLPAPEFCHKINLPKDVNPIDPLTIRPILWLGATSYNCS